MKKLAASFLIYSIAGAIATIVDWGSFFILNSLLASNYIFAVCISFTLGSLANFSLNKHITFRNKYRNIIKQYLLHIFVSIISLGITVLIMSMLINKGQFAALNARILTTFIVLFLNYFMHKHITFGLLK